MLWDQACRKKTVSQSLLGLVYTLRLGEISELEQEGRGTGLFLGHEGTEPT